MYSPSTSLPPQLGILCHGSRIGSPSREVYSKRGPLQAGKCRLSLHAALRLDAPDAIGSAAITVACKASRGFESVQQLGEYQIVRIDDRYGQHASQD